MRTETLQLKTAGGDTTAHVARPDGDAEAGVILIQEWWGINDHIRDLAGRYAKEGYLCVAPDLYRGRLAANPEEAAAFMSALAIEDGMATIRSAIDAAKPAFGLDRFAITGYCMGGTFALRAACEIPSLKAAAPFYGDTPPDNVLRELKVPTLFIAGKRDAWINPEKVKRLNDFARANGLPLETISYDADHAFFNDTRPQVYDAESAADAWRRVLDFFGKHFGAVARASRP